MGGNPYGVRDLYSRPPVAEATGYLLRSLRDQDLAGLRPETSLGAFALRANASLSKLS